MNNKSGSEGGDVVEQFNAFIKKWCGDSYPHLIDSDENDGERFRDNIRDLQKLCEEQKGELAELKHRSEVCQKFHGESFSMDRHVELMEAHEKSLSQLAHLNLVLEGYKVMAGLSTTDHLKVQGMIQKELEEQKAENERLNRLLELTRNKWNEDLAKEGRVVLLQSQLAEKEKEIAELKFVIMQRDAELTMRNDQLDKVRFQSDIYAKQVVLKEELINERSSQLATQTERVRVMRKALEFIVDKSNEMGYVGRDRFLDNCQYAAEQALNQESLGDGGKGE